MCGVVCVLARSTLSAVSLRITGVQQLHQVKRMIGGIRNMLFSVYFQTENVQEPVLTLVLHHARTC